MAQRPYENPAVARPRRAMAVLVAAVVFAVAGCGASSSGVKATDSTTVATSASTTVEDTTTTVDETTTTEKETTTTERRSPTTANSSDGWPEAAKTEFMKSCTSGSDAMKPTCECVLRGIEPLISVADLLDAGTTGSLPADMESMIEDYAKKCAVDPEAY